MASTRFKNVIAGQLAKLTGSDASAIARAIDRPKVKGRGTFSIPLPRLLPASVASGGKKSAGKRTTSELKETLGVVAEAESGRIPDARAALLARIQNEFDTSGMIRSVQPAGQFLNFTVNEPQYLHDTIQDVVRAENGKQSALLSSTSSTSSSSTATTSTSTGNWNAHVESLGGFGYQVVGINYLGDWGKQYGLMAVGFDRYGDRTKLHQDPIKHLYDVYVRINQDITTNPGLDKLANQYFKQMEDGDSAVLSLWQEFRSLSIDFYRRIYKRLGIEFDIYSGESESARFVPQAYELLRRKGLLKEEADGAWVVDLEEFGLGVCTLRRADGTTLYLTRDVAACLDRAERFKFDRHLYMIGDDQNLHMKRLFKIMELAFATEATEASKDQKQQEHWSRSLQHISFGKVQGMSTRKGNAVFLEDILDTAQSTMLEKMKENQAKFDAVKESSSGKEGEGSVESVADQLGISAVVIQDFQAKSHKGYEFSWKRMTESTGNTGIYLQYAYARLCGIADKSSTTLNTSAKTSLLTEPEAYELANMISQYPDITLSTLHTLEPSTIVNYLFGLSHAISSANQVLQVKAAAEAGEKELAEARFLLLWCARVTLGNGMRILGLEPLERM
ncbi:Arginyl-tRNA synthetase [Linnemannia hyalina]|uniref:arginine--tRNA ligase n=1 Tax=Linnemannia hyalina TaxID=64524 RepID=A0A9P7XXL5_9FUNG|nr:Arginyl-tRNA synthetase [Linnemannia hyalina]